MPQDGVIPFTREGWEKLSVELKQLKKKERPQIIKDIAEARAHGDLSENAEYHAAKEKQGMIEARILDLDGQLSRADIISYTDQKPDKVRFGAHVTVCNEETGREKTLQIVGELEADSTENRISLSSPIGRALLGKKVDDLVEINVPKGTIEYSILDIRY